MRIPIVLFLSVLLFACQAEPEEETASQQAPEVTIEGADQDNPPAPGLFIVDDDKDRFPYLQPLNDSTIKMAAYTVRLEASHSFPLQPLVPEKTPWFKGLNPNESQGIFLSYVIAGRRLMLSEPNVRIDYIQKTNPHYNSVDSAVWAVKEFFMPDPSSEMFKEPSPFTTRQGRDFTVMEVKAVRDSMHTPKFQAFAYMDYNADYLLSIHLTTTDRFAFKDALPAYYRLLRSVKVVDR